MAAKMRGTGATSSKPCAPRVAPWPGAEAGQGRVLRSRARITAYAKKGDRGNANQMAMAAGSPGSAVGSGKDGLGDQAVPQLPSAPEGVPGLPLRVPPVAESQVALPPIVPPPPQKTGWPAWAWVGIGIGLVLTYQKVTHFFTGGGLQKMMMQQMMKNMQGGGGMPGAKPGANPFAAGGFPPNMPGMNMPNMPGSGGVGMGFPPTGAQAASNAWTTEPAPSSAESKAMDTTAKPTPAPAATTPSSSSVVSEKAAEEEEAKPAPNGVEDSIKEESEPKKASVFQDVSESEEKTSSFEPKPVENVEQNTSTAASEGFKSPFFPEVMNAGANAGGQSQGQGEGGGMMDMVEQMMKDPKMQEMMYPYLPENMRNPETFKWILSNPAMRQQMEEMLANGVPGGMSPDMMNAMNANGQDFQQQFESMGMSPDDVLKKIMEDPELATAFQNPRVQQAMMDCSANPMNISKYTGDKEVMDAMIKMSQLFPGVNMP